MKGKILKKLLASVGNNYARLLLPLAIELDFVEDPDLPTAGATDGETVYLNFRHLKRLNVSDKTKEELALHVVLHELMHVLMGHTHRLKSDFVSNFIADLYINYFLDPSGSLTEQLKGLHPSLYNIDPLQMLNYSTKKLKTLLEKADAIKKEKIAETRLFVVYKLSIEFGKVFPGARTYTNIQIAFKSGSKPGKSSSNKSGTGKGNKQGNGQGIGAEGDAQGSKLEIARARVESKLRGSGSIDIFAKWILVELKKPIPWDELLTNDLVYVFNNTLRTWKSINLITFPLVVKNKWALLPGNTCSNGIKELIAVVDTSGSISEETLNKFMSILQNLLHTKTIEKLYLIQHTDCITKIDELTYPKNLNITIQATGGTSHKEVFDWIEKKLTGKNIRNIVFLTDYYSDVEEIYKSYQFPRSANIIWIIEGDLKPSFGKVYNIE